MSIVTHIAGERTSQFYTFRLLVYKNHWGQRQNVWVKRND
jgi:hypothetical protein